MVKKTSSPNDKTPQEDSPLGHDPFDDLDLNWIEQEEGDISIEVLGHDPFEDITPADWRGSGNEDNALYLPLPAEAPPLELADRPSPLADSPDVTLLSQVTTPIPVEGFTSESLSSTSVPPSPPPFPLQAPAPAPPTVPSRPPAIGTAPTVATVAKPAATFHFPVDFKWGVATAAHQVEGENILNDWWDWEQTSGHIKQGHTSGLACNWWENAEADFDRAADMGVNALRLSVEWSRVEPRPGAFDPAALDRYREMVQGLRQRGIEPMLTLHHFSSPRWLAEQGGWEAPETVGLFARFVKQVVETLGEYCDLWCTINEPNVYAYMGYVEGIFPPGKADFRAGMAVIRNMLAGHAAAYRQIHALQPHARVGLAHNMRIFDPLNPRSLLDRRVARLTDQAYNQAILTALTRGRWQFPLGFGWVRKLRRSLDWIGLNYYTRDLVAFDRHASQALYSQRSHAEGAELLDGGYGEFYPQGMFRSIERLARLGLPIYVTENGIPDADDDQRPRYLVAHIHQMWHAIQLCYPVMGYYHWTLVDNFEWAEGWTMRFGLIELDPATQVRRPRRSAHLYSEIIRANAITTPIVDTYTPELRPHILPG
ncbi:MAG TPA: glycoside hydrolase family 1 protein [Chloroflexi bacterium]|nr:glycoside hydrolase family 1 protein [Chloroflexota bacterium]